MLDFRRTTLLKAVSLHLAVGLGFMASSPVSMYRASLCIRFLLKPTVGFRIVALQQQFGVCWGRSIRKVHLGFSGFALCWGVSRNATALDSWIPASKAGAFSGGWPTSPARAAWHRQCEALSPAIPSLATSRYQVQVPPSASTMRRLTPARHDSTNTDSLH